MKSPYFTPTKIKIGFTNRTPYWISPNGKIILTTPLDHALYAIEYYKKQGIILEPEPAVEKMINEGWIRVQICPDGTSVIQGISSSLKKNGNVVLDIAPNLKAVGIAYVPWDYKEPPAFTRKEIDRMNWDELVDHAMKIGKAAKKVKLRKE